jgi:nucleoside-diphosphate-sugar epimerase
MGARNGTGMKRTFFIFGAGYSAGVFARKAIAAGHRVIGTTRSAAKFSELAAIGIEPLVFDGRMLGEDVAGALGEISHLVVSAAPDEAGDPVLRTAGGAIRAQMPRLRWIGYLSTVGVYGDHDGDWVDEASECRPVSKRSIARLEAEDAWRALAAQIGTSLAILRLSGIYGPGRNAFVNLEDGKARRIVKPGQVFNRIHVDDMAGALILLAEREADGIFNVTDDEPAPPQDVVAHAAGIMGADSPPEVPFDAAEMTPMARSFYGENKRVSNAKLKAAGYSFRFPTYRHALGAMWRDHTWRRLSLR